MSAARQIPVFEVGLQMKKGAPELHLRLVSERMTVRELIEARVAEEVARYNEGEKESLCSFEPNPTECRLNGADRGRIDVTRQTGRALSAFRAHRFMLFVDDRQVESLDEEVVITPTSEVLFVRLVPLAGG